MDEQHSPETAINFVFYLSYLIFFVTYFMIDVVYWNYHYFKCSVVLFALSSLSFFLDCFFRKKSVTMLEWTDGSKAFFLYSDRKNPPPPGGVSHLLCSLIKNRV